jgi:hypothetical protein
MSRRLLRCRNPACPIPHGAVLGRVTEDGGLVLDSTIDRFVIFFDTRKAAVFCPSCGSVREFRGTLVRSG